MKNSTSRRLALLAMLAIAMIVVPAVTSLPAGIAGVKDSGCNCHGTEADTSVTASITGLPETYNYQRPMQSPYRSLVDRVQTVT